eukprot:437444-Rhodomonas_salina.1
MGLSCFLFCMHSDCDSEGTTVPLPQIVSRHESSIYVARSHLRAMIHHQDASVRKSPSEALH